MQARQRTQQLVLSKGVEADGALARLSGGGATRWQLCDRLSERLLHFRLSPSRDFTNGPPAEPDEEAVDDGEDDSQHDHSEGRARSSGRWTLEFGGGGRECGGLGPPPERARPPR